MQKRKFENPEGTLLTVEQMASDSNLGTATVLKLAKEAGALIKIGRLNRIDPEKFYKFVETQCIE